MHNSNHISHVFYKLLIKCKTKTNDSANVANRVNISTALRVFLIRGVNLWKQNLVLDIVCYFSARFSISTGLFAHPLSYARIEVYSTSVSTCRPGYLLVILTAWQTYLWHWSYISVFTYTVTLSLEHVTSALQSTEKCENLWYLTSWLFTHLKVQCLSCLSVTANQWKKPLHQTLRFPLTWNDGSAISRRRLQREIHVLVLFTSYTSRERRVKWNWLHLRPMAIQQWEGHWSLMHSSRTFWH